MSHEAEAPFNPTGIKPHPLFWRLFEIEGFQMLVFLEERDDNEDRCSLALETAIESGVTVKIGLGPFTWERGQSLLESYADQDQAKRGLGQLLAIVGVSQ